MEENPFDEYEREKRKLPPMCPEDYEKESRKLAERLGI